MVVRGRPSVAMAERIEKEEKARLAKQRETLGEEGIAKAVKELEDAKVEHERPIPNEVLTSFPVPDVKSISWIPVQSLQEVGSGPSRRKTIEKSDNADLIRHIEADGSELPFFVQYDHVEVSLSPATLIHVSGLTRDLQSDFVTISAYLSLATLPDELRP